MTSWLLFLGEETNSNEMKGLVKLDFMGCNEPGEVTGNLGEIIDYFSSNS